MTSIFEQQSKAGSIFHEGREGIIQIPTKVGSQAGLPGQSSTKANSDHQHELNLSSAWIPWTPTATSDTFVAITAYTINSAAFSRGLNRTINWRMVITITTAGLAAGKYLLVTLPPTQLPSASFQQYLGSGRENAVNGKMVQIITSGPYAFVLFYDNTVTIQDNYSFILGGSYEAAA